MPYELLWEGAVVVKRFYGLVTNSEFMEPVIKIEADPRFDDLRFVINDLLYVEQISFDSRDVDELSAIDKAASRSNPKLRIAVVTTAPELIALARRYADSPMNVYPTRIFSTLAAARAWIDEAGGPRQTTARQVPGD